MNKYLLPLSLLLLGAAARAELIEIRFDAQGAMQRELKLAPGKFAELCGKLAAGQRVRWSFAASAPLNFNIHYHLGDKVEYPARRTGVAQDAGELAVDQDQDYCWMWSNKGSQAQSLSVTLQR